MMLVSQLTRHACVSPPVRCVTILESPFEDVVMLTKEMKLQAFMKLRTENYRASLRLEGLTPRPTSTHKPASTTATLKTKHAR